MNDRQLVNQQQKHYKQYRPFSVDKFVNNLNKKVKVNSKYFCPGTSLVNIFSGNWSRDHKWLCPLILCIGSALRQLTLCMRQEGHYLYLLGPISIIGP